jgi:hypothetical protein
MKQGDGILNWVAKVILTISVGMAAPVVHSETWSQPVTLLLVEPLASWQGGLLRIKTDTPIVTASCGTTTVLDFVYQGGTEESRKAVVAAVYMALAGDRQVRLYVSDTTCSAVGAPIFTGLDVLR